MILFPLIRETIVSKNSAQEINVKLWQNTYPVNIEDSMPDREEYVFPFNGWIKRNEFKIFRRLKSPENFLPLIKGSIEETSKGCLIFLRYSLFFSSNFFLVFWSVVTLFMSIFFIVAYDKVIYAVISLVLGVGNYAIAMANFNIQVKKSSEVLRNLLDEPLK